MVRIIEYNKPTFHKIQDFINLRNKKTIILGWRKSKKNMPILRIFSNVITSLLISLRTKTKILDSQCGFRMFPINVKNDFKCIESGFQYESEFLIKAVLNGYQIKNVIINAGYSAKSESSCDYDSKKASAKVGSSCESTKSSKESI